jgi:hypothetical protein
VTDDPVGQAINHPVGRVTEALLQWWYQRRLEDNQGLPPQLTEFLTDIADLNVPIYRHGRILLAQAAITLFRVDPAWTTLYVIPLFRWGAEHGEARLAWEGFLWNPRIFPPFLVAVHSEFLATARHYGELGEHADQFAGFLTFVALLLEDTFTRHELAVATAALPADGLVRTAKSLVSALRGSGDQHPEYWANRIVPYVNDIWPKAADLITDEISGAFADLCLAAQSQFPAAFEHLKSWLIQLRRPDFHVHLLNESSLCTDFPEVALAFLDATIGPNAEWGPRELPACLTKIQAANPALAQDPRLRRLADYARQHDLA